MGDTMVWQMRLSGLWAFGELRNGVVRDAIAEVAAVPTPFGVRWHWATGDKKGQEEKFSNAISKAEEEMQKAHLEGG